MCDVVARVEADSPQSPGMPLLPSPSVNRLGWFVLDGVLQRHDPRLEGPTAHRRHRGDSRSEVKGSRNHKARVPGTEMALLHAGEAKVLRASSSTTSRSGFCYSWVRGRGSGTGPAPLRQDALVHLLSTPSCESVVGHTNTREYTPQSPSAAPQGRSCSEQSWPGPTTSSVVFHQPHYGRVQTCVARHNLSAIEI